MSITTQTAQEIKTYFERRRSDVVALARRLVEAESPSGDAEGSRAVAALLVGVAREITSVSTFERISAREGYGEHLRFKAFGGAERGILIVGHTDTVHPRGSVGA